MPNERAQGLTASQLLSELSRRGVVADDARANIERFVSGRHGEKELPLFLRLMLALGAFIASLSFVAFLAAAHIIDFDHPQAFVFWGIAFIGAAIPLYHVTAGGTSLVQSWLTQISFSGMLTGKILFVFGVADQLIGRSGGASHVEWKITLTIAIVTAATYPIYGMAVDRFLSVFAVLMGVFFSIVTEDFRAGGSGAPLSAWFIVQLALAGWLMTSGRVRHTHLPAAYALVCSLCVIVLSWGFASNVYDTTILGDWRGSPRYVPDASAGTAALAAAMIGLIGWAAGGVEKLKTEPLALSCLGAALLGAMSAPGILLSIGLMTLGYARRDQRLIALGAVLLPVFIVLFYYNLYLSFAWKSAMLIASGGLLLAGRALMRYRGWDVEA
jgi:hypothetical protein